MKKNEGQQQIKESKVLKCQICGHICDLSLSGLDEVPVREIATFKRVTVVDLSSNRLVSLGKNFPSLTRLVKLDLSKNQIKYLPDDFGLLRNLRHLDLYDNNLEHLPLSFGNLVSLRYLDLKGNQLMPALAKIVGFCLTNKECQDSARNTVKFLAHMQTEAAKVQEQIQQEMLNQNGQTEKEQAKDEAKTIENQKLQKSKKSKSKNKKLNNNIEAVDVVRKKPNNKIIKAKKATSDPLKTATPNSTAALTSIFTFFLLLAINVIIIYMIMFKNPEIAEKLVEFIPHSYRDWILTKTEIFRLHVTDWITEFRTPPEEH